MGKGGKKTKNKLITIHLKDYVDIILDYEMEGLNGIGLRVRRILQIHINI